MAKHKNSNPEDGGLFGDFENSAIAKESGPVTVLGLTFENDEERRAYFRAELRAKLPELRQIEGFPIGSDDDIVNLSDPPYYTACPNPWLNDFIAEWEKEKKQLEAEGKRDKSFVVKEPYASDVSEGKANPIYMAHSYHTKVPHTAIIKYIYHYTQPGDIVFDGFSGSGMTGVAANLCGLVSQKDATLFRHSILTDLSPIASLISSAYNSRFTIAQFSRICNEVLNQVTDELGWLYQTDEDNEVMYFIWSDVYSCPSCNADVILWDNSVSKDTRTISDVFPCPICGFSCNKKNLNKKWISEFDQIICNVTSTLHREPVFVNYKNKFGQRQERKLNQSDYDTLDRLDQITISVDPCPIKKGDKTSPITKSHGYHFAHQFYSKRNYIILNRIRELLPNEPIFQAWFTSILPNASKMYKFRTDRKGGILTGTIFLPSLSMEINPFNLLRAKIKDFSSMHYTPSQKGTIQVGSSTSLTNIQGNSIDYIFIDPPFGANIMYSELNSFSESWLRISTDNTFEAIVSKSCAKSLFDYQNLMYRCFSEFYRILKPGKWMTVEFSNTSASVWNSIQTSLQNIGFIVAGVSALDKIQGSYNAVTSTTAVKQDLIISCFKPSEKMLELFQNSTDSAQNVWDFINELLEHLPVHIEREKKTTAVVERSPKILYDRLISYYVQRGLPVPIDARDFQTGLRERFLERDGMFFTADQAFDYENKKKATIGFEACQVLFVSSEAEGIEWLKRELQEPKTYADLTNPWNTAQITPKKGDKIPELKTILEENFIEDEDGRWRVPDPEKEADLEKIRNRRLAHEFKAIVEMALKPKSRIKDARLEALRYGFKEAYRAKDFETIVNVAQHLPEALVMEDEELLRYYDIASGRV